MEKPKYVRFSLVGDYGVTNEEYERYLDAFMAYQRCDSPKTLYGVDEQGDMTVIMSRKWDTR